MPLWPLLAVVAAVIGCPSEPATLPSPPPTIQATTVGYLELVTTDVDATCALYERMHGLSFGPKVEELGRARVAKQPDGTLVGIRAPLAAHEGPIVRAYLTVEDIDAAVKTAEQEGATIAYPPTKQGDYGSFAIVIQHEVEHGLWQP